MNDHFSWSDIIVKNEGLTPVLSLLSKALGLSADELLGITKTKDALDDQLSAVWRRLKVLEGFSEKDRKAVIHYVEVIAQKNKAEQKATDKRQQGS